MPRPKSDPKTNTLRKQGCLHPHLDGISDHHVGASGQQLLKHGGIVGMNDKLRFLNVLTGKFFVGATGINDHTHTCLINGFKTGKASDIVAAADGRFTAF